MVNLNFSTEASPDFRDTINEVRRKVADTLSKANETSQLAATLKVKECASSRCQGCWTRLLLIGFVDWFCHFWRIVLSNSHCSGVWSEDRGADERPEGGAKGCGED